MLYIFKIVSFLTFLKIVLLIVPINCKHFANLNSTSLGNLGQHHLTWHRPAIPNPTSSRPLSCSLGNVTLVVAERSGWRRVLGASKPRPSAKGAHPYRKRACLEALRLATTKRTQRRTGYPSWGHPIQLRFSTGSTGLIYKWLAVLTFKNRASYI